MNTQENNKQIAEFMGMTTSENDESMMIFKTPKGNEIIYTGKLKYHTSWDWLMPVVEECTKIIENYGYDDDDRNYIEDEIFNLDYTLSEFLNNDKESIYARVVEFIKWTLVNQPQLVYNK